MLTKLAWISIRKVERVVEILVTLTMFSRSYQHFEMEKIAKIGFLYGFS